MRFVLITAVAASLLGVSDLSAQRPHTDARTVREWILQYHADDGAFRETDGYAVSYYDLNRDGIDEALVFLRSQGRCGTGGCNLYVLASSGGR